MNTDSPLVIIGAGAAGLTAAYEAVRRGLQPLVLEKADKVGALPRTETFKGYRFDIGGHRFFSKVKEVERLWQEKLGEEWLKVPRLSRIHYRGRFFDNPFAPLNALMNLGPIEAARILLSYLQYKAWPLPEEDTFDIDWFGRYVLAWPRSNTLEVSS